MSTEDYFEEWWVSKELPENGFNKTAMLDFAEMYHNRMEELRKKQIQKHSTDEHLCKHIRREGESCRLNNKCTYPNCLQNE